MRKLKVVRVREGRERIAKEVEVGERDRETGVDFFYRITRYQDQRCITRRDDDERTFLNSYNPVSDFVVHSTASGFSKVPLGSQYSIIPPTSIEMTVSYLALYYQDKTKSEIASLETREGRGRTTMRCTLARCRFSSVCNGVPSPRPS